MNEKTSAERQRLCDVGTICGMFEHLPDSEYAALQCKKRAASHLFRTAKEQLGWIDLSRIIKYLDKEDVPACVKLLISKIDAFQSVFDPLMVVFAYGDDGDKACASSFVMGEWASKLFADCDTTRKQAETLIKEVAKGDRRYLATRMAVKAVRKLLTPKRKKGRVPPEKSATKAKK